MPDSNYQHDLGRDFIVKHGPKPPPIGHLGIVDMFIEKASVTHYFYRGKWLQLTGATNDQAFATTRSVP